MYRNNRKIPIYEMSWKSVQWVSVFHSQDRQDKANIYFLQSFCESVLTRFVDGTRPARHETSLATYL